jgi:hypothetical protein
MLQRGVPFLAVVGLTIKTDASGGRTYLHVAILCRTSNFFNPLHIELVDSGL